MAFGLIQVFVREKPTPDTSQVTHKGTIGAQQTSSQSEQRFHHQRDMTITHTLFLSHSPQGASAQPTRGFGAAHLDPIVHSLGEVGRQFFRQSFYTELPHSIPVGAHDLPDIGDPIQDDVTVYILAIDVRSMPEMELGTRRAGDSGLG